MSNTDKIREAASEALEWLEGIQQAEGDMTSEVSVDFSEVWELRQSLTAALEQAEAAPSPAEIGDADLEALAAYAHEAWSGWMDYLFSKAYPAVGGAYKITQPDADRWKRQARTPYKDLPESEKESDRKEARKMLAIISGNAEPPGETCVTCGLTSTTMLMDSVGRCTSCSCEVSDER